MKRVTGIGGVFFKVKDVQKTKDWYRDHLGFATTDWGATMVWGNPDPSVDLVSRTEWSPFKADTDYFNPGNESFMINYRVHDLRKLMEALKQEGVRIEGEIQEFDYGKFGYIMDNENRKIELWEPVDSKLADAPPAWTDRVTGLGGIFFKSADPKKTKEWYAKHLGMDDTIFKWKDLSNPDAKAHAQTIWAPFKNDTDYFNPAEKSYMFNYRVKNLSELMKSLKEEGVTIVGKIDEYPYGKFGWIMDPDENKIELWEAIDD
jgi:predicted enzyme related to lactoylglutathione lyase